MTRDRQALATVLADAGFIAAEEEADELLARAGEDGELLDALVARRLTGEPLAWLTGSVVFCDVEIRVDPGVYVPRPHSELLARRAIECLPTAGVAVDLCTGSGALAKVLTLAHPIARVIGCDVDDVAVACACANGVEARTGDLFAALPPALDHHVDLLVAVVPYVPTGELSLLQRDTFRFETTRPYDGGDDGLTVLRRVLAEAPRYLRDGATVLLELGGDEADRLALDAERHGFTTTAVLTDEDGDVRGVELRHR